MQRKWSRRRMYWTIAVTAVITVLLVIAALRARKDDQS